MAQVTNEKLAILAMAGDSDMQDMARELVAARAKLAGVEAGTHVIVRVPCKTCSGIGWVTKSVSGPQSAGSWSERCPSCDGNRYEIGSAMLSAADSKEG